MFELGIQRASQKALKKGIKEGIEKRVLKLAEQLKKLGVDQEILRKA